MTANPPVSPYLPGRLGFSSQQDVDEFVTTLARYERGELTADEWRAFRLVRGVYGQRQPDRQMLRVKIPEGILTAPQIRALAIVARRYADGIAHVTTRQNVQFHQMPLAVAGDAMQLLANAGLTTREACGHSVRNITSCPLAGVDPSEVFDVTPYADATSRFLLRGPLSATLPRKFKIAFEGCAKGCVQPAINDLAFVARIQGGRRGFLVLSGGGLATLPRAARPLIDWLPAGDLLALGLAVLRVFDREGNRRNKQRARLKWVIERIGFEPFRATVLAELAAIQEAGAPALPFDPAVPPVEPSPPSPPPSSPAEARPGFGDWRRDNVLVQRQEGYAAAFVTLALGDATADQLDAIALLCEQHGDGTIRTTNEQNLALRFVPMERLPALHAGLQAIGLGRAQAGEISDVTGCPGADTCNIAVTASRGLGRLLTDHLRDAGLASGAHVKISGCPNGCGQHQIATFGLQGGLRKIGGRPLPVYHLTIGGDATSDRAQFGRLVGKLPARRVPFAIDRLLELYRRERAAGESIEAFTARLPLEQARATLADLLGIDEASARPEDFVDLGQEDPFAIGAGEGECAGG